MMFFAKPKFLLQFFRRRNNAFSMAQVNLSVFNQLCIEDKILLSKHDGAFINVMNE